MGRVCLFVCSYFSYYLIVGKDRTLRIWNFKTGYIELLRQFFIDIHSIDIHPSGLFVAIGFADQFRLMKISLEDVEVGLAHF